MNGRDRYPAPPPDVPVLWHPPRASAAASRRPGTCHRSPRAVTPDALLTLISAGGAAVGVWPLLVVLGSGGPLALAPTTAHVSGMLAGYAVVVLIGLMSRTPALERGVGADRLARWHARGGRITVTLILLHALAALAAWAQSRGDTLPAAAWNLLRLPNLIATTVGTALLITVAAFSVRAARRRLSYESWHTAHLLTYIAVALTFLHQLAGPDLAGHRLIQLAWALLYTHVFGLVLVHRVLTPMRQASRHRLRVAAVHRETADMVTIDVTGQHLDELHAEAGQFFRWRFLAPDHWRTAHPFSLSAPPTATTLRLTVKALGDGSTRLQRLEPGTWVIAEGPYGAMTADRRTRPDVLLIAGGVGITPIRALFETIPITPGQDLTLLYRARNEHSLIFRAELDAIATRRDARVIYLVGEDRQALSTTGLRRLVPNLADRDVYFCGPPALSAAVRASLRHAGLPDTQFHEEAFAF